MSKFVTKMEPGTYYHIFNRACGFEKLFLTHGNYVYFLKLYEKYVIDIVDTYAYCLLPNHFHFLIKPKEFNDCVDDAIGYSRRFAILFNTYARSFNSVYNRKGSLFSQNYKRKEIKSLSYLRSVIIYIHRNPINHGYVKSLNSWEHFSYCNILNQYGDPLIKNTNEVLKLFEGKKYFEIYHTLDFEIDIE